MKTMLVPLAVVAVLLASCGGPTSTPRAARPRISPGAPEIYEHERAGHVPSSLVPGRWRSGNRVLVLGQVNEVRLDGEPIGTYTAHMDGFEFATDVHGCSGATWSFDEGDLVLRAGPACPVAGRWDRDG